MIINYPTGFYGATILSVPGVASNITYTISNTQPPRTQLLFAKTPAGLSRRKKPPRVFSDAQRRAAVSKLAFSVVSGKADVAATGMRQYEVGQILEFQTGQAVSKVDPMLVAGKTEARHDTNLFDFDAIGLDSATQELVNNESAAAYKILLSQLNDAVRNRANYEVGMQGTQKLLNEVNKTLDGLAGVYEISPSAALAAAMAELESKRDSLTASLATLVVQANDAAALALVLNNKINRVAQLVR